MRQATLDLIESLYYYDEHIIFVAHELITKDNFLCMAVDKINGKNGESTDLHVAAKISPEQLENLKTKKVSLRKFYEEHAELFLYSIRYQDMQMPTERMSPISADVLETLNMLPDHTFSF